MRRSLALAAALVLGVAGLAPPAEAGGGPETTLIVVNAASPSSLRVANEYASLRKIPATHLCFLEDVPPHDVIGVDEFRERIWKPVKAFLEANRLLDSIDCIAYSVGFPYGVDFAADRAPPYAAPLSAIASLTSMTYLARRVEKKDAEGYLDLGVNGYFRRVPGLPAPQKMGRVATDAERELAGIAGRALQAKDYAAAAAALEDLLKTRPDHFGGWYDLACCRALLGKADAAMAALEHAVTAGWSDADHTRRDDDLTSLRGRQDFKALLAKMEEAAKAAASADPETAKAHGFRSRYSWTGGGNPGAAADSLDRYWLSTLLGYTGERGNSVPEVLACLESGARSDGTHPKGTVYLLKNGDVRSTTREPFFADAVEALHALGHAAEILSKEDRGQTGILPVEKSDVMGAVVGIAGFAWPDSRSRLLPGSIAEHLTSCGAQFNTSAQTKISEFLRYGAAGSSGAVAEPFALQWKFPVPHIHAHYAEGCSLAESFYESTWGPYQLLVVGEPLARPFADFAQVAYAAPSAATPMAGKVGVSATVTPAKGKAIANVELWIDGRFALSAPPASPIEWDTATAEDGVHDLRLVAVEEGRIETRSFVAQSVTVSNAGRQATIAGPKSVVLGEAVNLTGRAVGAKEVEILEGSRVLGTAPVNLDSWRCTVPSSRLGMGPVSLTVRSSWADGPKALSAPLAVAITAPPVRKGSKAVGGKDGLKVVVAGATGKPQEVDVTTLTGDGGDTFRRQIEAKVKGPLKQVEATGDFEVKAAGLYELAIRAPGAAVLEIDGKPASFVDGLAQGTAPRRSHALVSLSIGWHSMKLKVEGTADVDVQLGGDQVAVPLAGKMLRR